ncbi:DUF5302 domain-containing protein [Motilibacter aurantiacus]|uniref:DUF5302 domain-containing protein n=1 Tax=Motilibacter aurantiacus TaxID=2714955 RepID=UPI00140A2F37|nr:DUF5302 domain-containing protein [Motilibacter aurantiacus]NHC44459.1 DUF5302 domain-containing protein [Motilibacter aurantiacus]
MADEAPNEPAEGAADTPSADDDMRARFREALAHKQGHGAPGRPGGNQPHVGGHGNAKVQRQFRRKSG